jgi:hypothetical protein
MTAGVWAGGGGAVVEVVDGGGGVVAGGAAAWGGAVVVGTDDVGGQVGTVVAGEPGRDRRAFTARWTWETEALDTCGEDADGLLKEATWMAMTAPLATRRMGRSPAARRRLAGEEDMGVDGTWVGNV